MYLNKMNFREEGIPTSTGVANSVDSGAMAELQIALLRHFICQNFKWFV